MERYVRHHYVPQFVLKNFKLDGRVYNFNHIEFSLNRTETKDLFMVERLYNYDKVEDIKEIEINLGQRIETPMGKIVSRLIKDYENNSINEFTITRKELLLIKKYMLLQFYRTEGNMSYYIQSNVKTKHQMSEYNIEQGEDTIDFWKREMKFILDNDWKNILTTDLVGVRKFAEILKNSYMGIFIANSEFVLSDLGKVAERFPFKLSKEMLDGMLDFINKENSGQFIPDLPQLLKEEYENQSSYVDNFYIFPIHPKIGLIMYDPNWRYEMEKPNTIGYLKSNLSRSRYKLPTQKYKYHDQMLQDQKIYPKYFCDEDEFVYTLQFLTEAETIYINRLMMNEAMRAVAFKSPDKVLSSIKSYQYEYNNSTPGVKRNYSGLVDLLINEIGKKQ